MPLADNFQPMLAARAVSASIDDPLSALEVGEVDEPNVPEGWALVDVKAVSLNHHDVWSLRGIGLPEERLPMIIGCDAAGIDDEGNEVVVHAVLGDPEFPGGEIVDPKPHPALRAPPRHAGRAGRGAAPQPGAEAGGPQLRGGLLPADRLADRLPHALRPLRPEARPDGADPGRRAAASPAPRSSSAAPPASASGRPAARSASATSRSSAAPTPSSSPAPGCRRKSTSSSRRSARRPGDTRCAR